MLARSVTMDPYWTHSVVSTRRQVVYFGLGGELKIELRETVIQLLENVILGPKLSSGDSV